MRTNQEQITPQEVQAYNAFAAEHNIVNDASTAGSANGEFIAKYFMETWKADITPANLSAAFEVIRPHLKFYEPDQVEFNRYYGALSTEEKLVFGDWKGQIGLRDTHRNAVAILSWLSAHNWKVSEANLRLAIGQQMVMAHLEWDEDVARPHYTDPRQHKDDGKGFLPKDEVNISPLEYARRRRAATEEASSTAAKPTGPADAWETIIQQQLKDGTHGQQAASRKIYDAGITAGKSLRQISAELNSEKLSRQRLVSASRF